MSQDDPAARITGYLPTLRRLKETSSRREVVEREILLAVLAANRDRLSEIPNQDADQQNLAATIAVRSELQPAHEHYQDWITQFLALLYQYDVAVRTGAKDQDNTLLDQILNLETLLCKCLQGYVIFAGVVRDEFNDMILARFGEAALADIDEITHAGFSDDHYWKALLDRFVFGFVNKGYVEALEKERFKLSREGSFVAVRFPLDALLEQMPGTDKQIDKTRLQAAFEATGEDPLAIKAAAAFSLLLAGLSKPVLPPKSAKTDFDFLGRVAAMDPSSGRFVEVFVDGQLMDDEEGSREPGTDSPARKAARIEGRKEFLKNQLLAMAVGAALSMGTLREDLGKALQGFTPREQEILFGVLASFNPSDLLLAHTFMLEYALSKFLTDKLAEEGAKVQVKSLKQRRASQQEVDALAVTGLNRIRQKLFFDHDPASAEWLLFKARNGQELAEAMKLSNIEPVLAQALTVLWTKMNFKTEVVVLVNLSLIAKTTQNVQGKVGEILSKLGVVKAGQA
ncbi:MAG: hypothetical protein HY795_09030 [Desulfovibrio sp.]|nr:hypothetical protein [Desulfovibrio sp.]MBI4958558.1 hypothetical protein [Desulfovibrio sp.]